MTKYTDMTPAMDSSLGDSWEVIGARYAFPIIETLLRFSSPESHYQAVESCWKCTKVPQLKTKTHSVPQHGCHADGLQPQRDNSVCPGRSTETPLMSRRDKHAQHGFPPTLPLEWKHATLETFFICVPGKMSGSIATPKISDRIIRSQRKPICEHVHSHRVLSFSFQKRKVRWFHPGAWMSEPPSVICTDNCSSSLLWSVNSVTHQTTQFYDLIKVRGSICN